MSKAFASALWAAVFFGALIWVLVTTPIKPDDFAGAMIFGGGLLTWLLVSIGVFVWRFREWRDSRYVTFIYWR